MMTKQQYTSEKTSLKHVPALIQSISFKAGTINLDFGGGKYDLASEYLLTQQVVNLVYDPFNRSDLHNDSVLNVLQRHKAYSATVANVLNVIKEDSVILEALLQVKSLVRYGGGIYISIYEGNKTGVGKETTKGWQRNEKAKAYLEKVKSVFPNAIRNDNYIFASNI